MRNQTPQDRSVSFAHSLRLPAALALAVLAAVFSPGFKGWQHARAQVADISNVPVFATPAQTVQVKPNLFFIMDDSGSMGWTYMPDEANDFGGRYGMASSQCNGVYYNPNITYTPPVDAAGTSYAPQTFTSARNDGFGVSSTGSTDLSVNFRARSADGAEAAYYYVYTGTQTTEQLKNYYDTNSTFYRECRSSIGNAPGNAVFTKRVVSSTSGPGSTDERVNFANWYSYYRTRMNMMKTATGLAFKTLDKNYRVGYMTINGNTSPSFLNIDVFTGAQRTNFYSQLYAADPNNSTPLREALSEAGRLYANKISTINGVATKDPVEYSCQQNYTILSTDGQWNGAAGVRLDGTTAIGNQDGGLPRPFNDGSQVTTTTVKPYTSTQDRTTTSSAGTITRTWARNNTVVGAACTATTAPNNAASNDMAIGNSGRTGALYQQSADPDGSGNDRCESLESGVWMCRTGQSANLPSGTTSNVKVSVATGNGGGAKTWYLVSNIAGQTGCRTAANIFGDTAYSSTAGACPATTITGSRVTVTPQTQTESVSTYAMTVRDRFIATQTTTQTTVNGTPGSVGAMTPTTPVYNLDSTVPQVIVTPESAASRTCGGTSFAFPTTCGAAGVGTWANGTPTINNQCVAAASVPAAGFSAPVLGTTVTTGATSNTTTAQLSSLVLGTDIVTSVGTGGVANTLADVSAYYYATNMRTSALGNCTGPIIAPSTTPNDLCVPNTVPPNGQDVATYQHMTTFTVGLGVRGRMVFSPSYLTDTTGDFWNVFKGNTATSTQCTWRDTLTTAGGACNWPMPEPDTSKDQVGNTDDLWHTAVNGRGTYFSATDPANLASGLTSTLKAIINTPRPGTASAAATTNPRITSANAFQFSSYFKTVEWSGELIRQPLSLADGSVPYYDPFNPDPASYDWSAQTQLDARAYTTRSIYTSNGSALVNFNWTNLNATQRAFFTAPYISTSPPQFPNVLTGLSQFCTVGANCISTTAQAATTVATSGAAGEALVNFLRGDRSNEEVTATTPNNAKFYRYRKSALGDIISAQPVYVAEPRRLIADSGYSAFKTLWATRTPLLYVPANDGMLHAFNANTGSEAWAYVPSLALPRMYTLADKAYGEKHQYFVEGTPVIGDVCPKAPALTCAASEWKTILVAGLNAGGTGYYALDITDPASPKLLWEFTSPNMGFSFGKPQITKLDNGQWVVLLTSGYNDCPRGTGAQVACTLNGTGDGQGRLFVLNADTGAQLTGSPISTGVGSATAPSGLGQIIAQVDSSGITRRVYGGDLQGNLWRFSLPTAPTSTFSVHRLAILKDGSTPAKLQPITVRPQVTTINNVPIVYVGTGRYLGATDVNSASNPNPVSNSFYAIKDDLTTTTTYNSPRTYTSFIGQRAVNSVCPPLTDVDICKPGQAVREVTQVAGAAGDTLLNKDGWYTDFPAGSNEIQFTDPKLWRGTVVFTTSVPAAQTSSTCSARTGASDGDSFIYLLDFLTGGTTTTSSVIASGLGSGVATAPQIIQLPSGETKAITRKGDGGSIPTEVLDNTKTTNATRRISWRELLSE